MNVLLTFSLLCVSGGRELHSDCLALVQAPTIEVESQLTLPLDINNYPISKFIQLHFRVIYASRFISTLPLNQTTGVPAHFGNYFSVTDSILLYRNQCLEC